MHILIMIVFISLLAKIFVASWPRTEIRPLTSMLTNMNIEILFI